jgi:hypothetical protein
MLIAAEPTAGFDRPATGIHWQGVTYSSPSGYRRRLLGIPMQVVVPSVS